MGVQELPKVSASQKHHHYRQRQEMGVQELPKVSASQKPHH